MQKIGEKGIVEIYSETKFISMTRGIFYFMFLENDHSTVCVRDLEFIMKRIDTQIFKVIFTDFAYYSKQTTFEKLRLKQAAVRRRARDCIRNTEYFIKQNKNSFFYKTLQLSYI